MSAEAPGKPDWNRLYETASAQEGYFTTRQAAEAGYSSQLLLKHLRAGRVLRIRRGVFRLVHFPAGDHEELAVAWLWSERAGVFSHETALALHGLSDVLPGQIDLTLPADWRHRRFRVPERVVLHHADVPMEDRVWFGPVPVTSPRRTLRDCATENISPELLRQAARQAIRRGIVVDHELTEVEKALVPFGGLAI
jgi:predicted transcriptional regulator of viral defense system